jgi:hypothetical protein
MQGAVVILFFYKFCLEILNFWNLLEQKPPYYWILHHQPWHAIGSQWDEEAEAKMCPEAFGRGFCII